MKIVNELDEEFEIAVSGYCYEQSFGKLFESDCLIAELKILRKDNFVITNLDFLLVEELERIKTWFTEILSAPSLDSQLDFVDPNLNMYYLKDGSKQLFRVIYTLYYVKDESWEIEANQLLIGKLIQQLETLLTRFPCRCKQVHGY
jgi:hypothetical protein